MKKCDEQDVIYMATFTMEIPGMETNPEQHKSTQTNQNSGSFWKALATIAVCAMGGFCMWLTDGKTGAGWAILGILLIW